MSAVTYETEALTGRDFPERAREELRDSQLRGNIRKATTTIRAKTAEVTGELPDWQDLRRAGQAIKREAMRDLARNLEALEANVSRAGGKVHWARDAAEARWIITNLAQAAGAEMVIKVKSMTTDEIGLNPALAAAGIRPIETDLADMIVQLGHDTPSHILVPAIHKNRAEIREIFMRAMGLDHLGDQPTELTAAARRYLRERFLSAEVAISGGNFGIADTGTICVLESEGNGRMCLSLPRVLITLLGIEKVLPRFEDLEVFLQLLPRASTGERMNPYTNLWTGVREGDGPQEFHLVLLDNGRSRILADPVARETLHCIRCSRCLNVCPVYERTGGHAYNSMYQGPIGAILTPQLRGFAEAGSLPYASTLCGACFEACPVRINIPQILIHLRGEVVREKQATLGGRLGAENLAMQGALAMFEYPALMGLAQRLGRVGQKAVERDGRIDWLPPGLSGWTASRDMPALPPQSFRAWWRSRRGRP
ncbi:MAG: lactate utilization protein [Acetobacteraceae bacterium]|nr:lactate utilization protein [Acetobacteraceae bacterium]